MSGTVTDSDGNRLEGVHVRWQGHGDEALVVTDAQGQFELVMDGPPDYQSLYMIGVAKKGYFSLGGGVDDGGQYTIPLERVSAPDNTDYRWIPPDPGNPASPFSDGTGCGSCHADYYDWWKTSRHAIAAKDPRVLDLYTGTGGDGTNPSQGPGYRLDNPDRAGMCGNCHAATAALTAGAEVALNEVSGAHTSGVYCESCHKVRELGEAHETPVTGAFGYWRPANGVLMAFGPLDDAFDDHHMGPMSFLPEMKQARFCGGCHEWTNEQGVPVMETLSEWAAGGYAAMGMVCQDCHMRPLDQSQQPRPVEPANYQAGDPMCLVRNPSNQRQSPGDYCDRMGAVFRSPDTINPHAFAGADDEHLNAATGTTVVAEQKGAVIDVEVTVENTGAGHKFPTGMPFRNAFLHVAATGPDGSSLALLEGPVLPDWAGSEAAPLAGDPGRMYVKVVGDGTEENVPFWRATEVVSDTRIPPMGKDVSYYRFATPEGAGDVTIVARVVYRRYLPALAESKGWPLEEKQLDLERATVTLAGPPSEDTTPAPDVVTGEDTVAADTETPPTPEGKVGGCCAVVRHPGRTPASGSFVAFGLLLGLLIAGRSRRHGRWRLAGLALCALFLAVFCVACGDDGGNEQTDSGTDGGDDTDVTVGDTTQADTAVDVVEPGELPASRMEAAAIPLKALGQACAGHAQCESGRCAGGCNGAYVCVPATCSSNADCDLGGAGVTACCSSGICTPIRGTSCGAGDAARGEGCASGGTSDCAAGLECIDVCEPTAVCAASCDMQTGTCDAPIDEVTGRPIEMCAITGPASAHCVADPEIVGRCETNADCNAEHADAICDWFLGRSGEEVVLMCNDHPWGPNPPGAACSSWDQCEVGLCWSGGQFNGVCAGLCRPELGDADCACPAGATGCTDQICVPMPLQLSETDPNLVDTVPICYDGTRCTSTADCGTGRYCDAADFWDELTLVCRPLRTGGAADRSACTANSECASGYCAAGMCAVRTAVGASCSVDDECHGRCIGGVCTQPCTTSRWCIENSGGALTSCTLVDVPYGPPGTGATVPVTMCAP